MLTLLLLLLAACGSTTEPPDGATDAARLDAGPIVDAPPLDAPAVDAPLGDGAATLDARPPTGDAAVPTGTLSDHRDRLLATLAPDTCATWAAFDASQRAVFLTLTHRLFLSRLPDGEPMLAHITRLHLVLGGGADGTSCGGDENNRLFLSMDATLHGLMVATWDGERVLPDGGGSTFVRTRDIAGPHDPFDASIESDVGLRCVLLVETSESRPPTAQAHFFLDGSAVPVERGSRISLPSDPFMLEIDHDYDCLHRSNPTCADFEDRYRDHYGDFECDWAPTACMADGMGCYRGVAGP